MKFKVCNSHESHNCTGEDDERQRKDFEEAYTNNNMAVPIGVDHLDASDQSTFMNNDTMASVTAELNLPYTVCEILVAVCAVVGNSLVLIVFSKNKKLRRRTNYYIISLATADLLVGLFAIPFAILASIGLPQNFHACLFTVSVLVVLCTISIFCLVAVSIDRYWAILYPMGYSRNVRTKTAIVIICVCWITGTLVGFLPLFGWNAGRKSSDKCIFTDVMDDSYLVFLYVTTIICPALLIAAFYAHIYRVIVKQMQQIMIVEPGKQLGKNHKTGTMLRLLGAAQKREVKATQNLSRIVIFFIMCWFPLYTINCIEAFCHECSTNLYLINCCIILSHLNSVGNPVLYAYHLKDFRAALKKFIYCLVLCDTTEQPRKPLPKLSTHRTAIMNNRKYLRRNFSNGIPAVNPSIEHIIPEKSPKMGNIIQADLDLIADTVPVSILNVELDDDSFVNSNMGFSSESSDNRKTGAMPEETSLNEFFKINLQTCELQNITKFIDEESNTVSRVGNPLAIDAVFITGVVEENVSSHSDAPNELTDIPH